MAGEAAGAATRDLKDLRVWIGGGIGSGSFPSGNERLLPRGHGPIVALLACDILLEQSGFNFREFAHIRVVAQFVLRGCGGQWHSPIESSLLEKFWLCAVPGTLGEIHRRYVANWRWQQPGARRSERATGRHRRFAGGGAFR